MFLIAQLFPQQVLCEDKDGGYLQSEAGKGSRLALPPGTGSSTDAV